MELDFQLKTTGKGNNPRNGENLMGMRIKTNTVSQMAQRHLGENYKTMSHTMERLSSGKRINRSSDDSAGLAVSANMTAQIRGMQQAKRNSMDAVSMLQVAEGGMNEMTNIMVRMRELAVQSATDTIGLEERLYLNREYLELAAEIDRISHTAEFNGNKFFIETPGIDRSAFTIQVGPNGTPIANNEDTISIDLRGLRFSSTDLNLGQGNEIGPSLIGDAGPDRDTIAKKISTVDSALERIARERATIGALQNRLTSTINNLGISVENMQQSRSRIIETDYAEETAHLTHESILTQAGLSVLAQANNHPKMALQLLQGN